MSAVVPSDLCACCMRQYDEPNYLYMVLDHDHATGMLRDYICQSCNHLVGRFERGATILSRAALERVAAYVWLHSGCGAYEI